MFGRRIGTRDADYDDGGGRTVVIVSLDQNRGSERDGDRGDSLLGKVRGVILLARQVHVDEDRAFLDVLHHGVLHEVVERSVCERGKWQVNCCKYIMTTLQRQTTLGLISHITTLTSTTFNYYVNSVNVTLTTINQLRQQQVH